MRRLMNTLIFIILMTIPADLTLPSWDVSLLNINIEHLTVLEVNIHNGIGDFKESE